ncbi:MAG: UrcA family protein [Proteobacteria bacterium]|nr:UrcA family protein [Pseudomonadota bacterium]
MERLPVLMTLAVLAVSTVAATPAAHASDERRSAIVRYGDLDLSNAQGAGTLFHRLRSAAAAVCAQPAGRGDHLAVPQYQHCLDAAMGDAVQAVGEPAVAAYAHAHGISATQGTRAN